LLTYEKKLSLSLSPKKEQDNDIPEVQAIMSVRERKRERVTQ
jgi:hypothetical protein